MAFRTNSFEGFRWKRNVFNAWHTISTLRSTTPNPHALNFDFHSGILCQLNFDFHNENLRYYKFISSLKFWLSQWDIINFVGFIFHNGQPKICDSWLPPGYLKYQWCSAWVYRWKLYHRIPNILTFACPFFAVYTCFSANIPKCPISSVTRWVPGSTCVERAYCFAVTYGLPV